MVELSDLSGVGPTTLQKLEEVGISSLMTLAVTSPVDIATTTGISEKAARKLIAEARENLKLGFEKAKDYKEKRSNVFKVSTGCSSFDEMLNGGFESGSVTEVYGRTASGKSQLSHTMAVRALTTSPTAKAIFIDSENTFRADRIKDISEANKLDYDSVMERLYVARSYNSSHQLLLVEELEKMLQSDDNYKLLVIDSITSHFRADFSGRGELANRQQLLNKHLHQLLKIADIHNMVVIVTNQVSSNPAAMFGNPEMPIGGNILSHSVTSIIYLRPGKAGSKVGKLVDSPNLPQNECEFNITKNGIEDV